MNREEAVVLVSRALGCIQAISALLYLFSLPGYLVSLHHHLHVLRTGDSDYSSYLASLDRIDIAFLFGRVAVLCALALVFWNCGPRIARFLLPERKSLSTSA